MRLRRAGRTGQARLPIALTSEIAVLRQPAWLPLAPRALLRRSDATAIGAVSKPVRNMRDDSLDMGDPMPRGHYRHTKIIATIGPATESVERLGQLISMGVDVLRLNMAHGTGEWAASLIKRVREVSRQVGRQVAVMMDIKGPEIRTGAIDQPIELGAGDHFELYTAAPSPNVRGVSVNYAGLPTDVKVGGTVLVDSGLIRMEVIEIDPTRVLCRVITPGKI